MSTPTIGSLCSGYGGLDMAVEEFFGARTAWFSEFDPAPSKVLAHHWPDVPNLGDMTRIDWSAVEPVDIIAGGTPCQDLSGAGKRKGMTEGTRSNLWVQMREAIAVIRPSIVIWENVRGAFSAYATSEVESESGLLGVYGLDRPALRALGRVLGDLSDLGYDTEWVGVRASEAGAPHGRFRVFVLAHAGGVRRGQGGSTAPREAPGWGAPALGGGRGGAPVADPDDDGWRQQQPRRSGEEEPWVAHPARAVADAERGGRDGRAREPFGGAVGRAAVTGGRADATTDTDCDGLESFGRIITERRDTDGRRSSDTAWGNYEPAIRRWELVLGRFAPSPTERSVKGSQRLSPRFVEWMMGVPEGHVTDPVIGLTRNQQLKALGNGVVPQQAELAFSILWPRMVEGVAA